MIVKEKRAMYSFFLHDEGTAYAIRSVRDEDSAELIGLIGACWAEYPGCVLDVDAEEPWLRAPARSYADRNGAFWVVDDDGQVVGCVGFVPDQDSSCIELKSLYVAKRARRRGLGARLVQWVEDAAEKGGAVVVRLWSDTRFTDAHRLYGRLGYARTGRVRDLHDLSSSREYEFAKTLGDS